MKKPRYIKYIMRIEILSNLFAAVGALAISAVNTNRVMSSAGVVMGWAAVLALEVGLAGLVLRITKDLSKEKKWFSKFWSGLLQYGAPVLVVLILISTNLLARVDLIGFGLSEVVYDIIQLGVLGAFIPFLALMNLHAARDVLQKAHHDYEQALNAYEGVVTVDVTPVVDTVVKEQKPKAVRETKPKEVRVRKPKQTKPSTEERREDLKALLETTDEADLNKSELGRKYGVGYQTIYADIKKILEEKDEVFDTF